MPWYLSIASALVGLVLLGLPWVLGRRQRAAARWPTASGRITRSEVDVRNRRHQGHHTAQSYVPVVEYVYRVDDVEFTNARYSFAWAYTQRQAEAIVQRHPEGAEVEVRYDPDAPSQSVIDPGEAGVVGPFLFGGVLFLAFGVAGLFVDYPTLLESWGFN